MDKLTRIEAKLDALLTKQGIKPESVIKEPPAPKPVPLTAAEQQAINNAPKPTPPVGPQRGPRVTPLNAPSTASSTPEAKK
jgi:hypothetical protein